MALAFRTVGFVAVLRCSYWSSKGFLVVFIDVLALR